MSDKKKQDTSTFGPGDLPDAQVNNLKQMLNRQTDQAIAKELKQQPGYNKLWEALRNPTDDLQR